MKGKQHPSLNRGLTKQKRRIIQKLLKIYKPYELNSRKQAKTQVDQLTFLFLGRQLTVGHQALFLAARSSSPYTPAETQKIMRL